MSQGRAYLSGPGAQLYMVELEVSYEEGYPLKSRVEYFGPYGTRSAARGKRTTELNRINRYINGTASARVFECQPKWEEVID